MEVFGSSGTRGTVNETFTPEFVVQVAQAAGSVWDAERAAVARDTRATGGMLADAAASGLTSVGVDVDRIGRTPTPAAQAYAEREQVPVVIVTASHNPPEFNGIKLIGPDGVGLSVDALELIEDEFLDREVDTVPWDQVGRRRRVSTANDDYVAELLSAVDRERIADADLTVALDPGHGAGALTSPEFFRALGCDVVTVNAQPDGHFPGRDPEPIEGNLGDLGRLVRTAEADLGVAHDGDGDRAIFFDEHGEFIEGDAALAALSAAELDPGDTTVSAVNVSQRLVDAADDADATLELTPIGSTHIVSRILELQREGAAVPIAGEGNGGIFFPEYRLARDGAYTAARFLELVAERRASEVVAPFAGYHNVRRNLHYADADERDRMLDAAAEWADAEDAEETTIDGYRLDYGDAWVLTRPSGTEPLIRVYAEARDKARAEELASAVTDALEDGR
ncbi:phosphomannomutase / phosphoglucomutase [Natronoarchaeum philippinense]|uniref:Phosphomannomutase / phosphoglucomutase n=1 Tax=Natronoarchaeum philippinense TaxID=558529 RepID=A0A285P8M5_NATPI|nr:phosphoglucosamine mutase [Natronoarchaeum philippinense]SNZ17607.1 phosphomannomutase / phosphoglucomutase [Natronoarchaeum philippinense]